MRVAVVLLALVVGAAGATAYFVLVAEDDEPARAPRPAATPSYEQRARLSETITRDRDGLTLQGVYLVGVALEDDCVRVSLLNPTAANVAYIESRFRGACVARDPGTPAKTCRETTRPLTRDGRVTVPNLLDLRLGDASRRVLGSDLVYSAECLGDAETAAWDRVGMPDALVRVTAQCPRPGEEVRAGTEVALQAATTLPGGYEYTLGALDEAATGTASPCGDGRNPTG